MFTGIIEEIGHIKAVKKQTFSQVLVIEASKVLEGTDIGDSIAVNGICLTVTAIGKGQFSAFILYHTALSSFLISDIVPVPSICPDTMCPPNMLRSCYVRMAAAGQY